MIINHTYYWIEDISHANDIFHIDVDINSITLSAATWIFKRENKTIAEIRSEAIYYVLDKIKKSAKEWKYWLLVANKALQVDSKIIRHIGLWELLKKREIKFHTQQYLDYHIIANSEGIRFFGALVWDATQLDMVIRLITDEQATVVLSSSDIDSNKINNITKKGWQFLPFQPPKEIIRAICIDNGIVIYAIGDFDDPEMVIVALGKKQILQQMNLNK